MTNNKLNSTIYDKLILQANEAKEQGLTKIAGGILGSIGSISEDEQVSYGYDELQMDLYEGMWKTATSVLKYYDLNSVDAKRLSDTLETLAEHFLEEMEKTLDIGAGSVGGLEEKVPGQE